MVLLVVDIQKGITDERLYAFDSFIENTSRIIESAKENNVEVIYIPKGEKHDCTCKFRIWKNNGKETECSRDSFSRIDEYTDELTDKIKDAFGERLMYIGLQGGYFR